MSRTSGGDTVADEFGDMVRTAANRPDGFVARTEPVPGTSPVHPSRSTQNRVPDKKRTDSLLMMTPLQDNDRVPATTEVDVHVLNIPSTDKGITSLSTPGFKGLDDQLDTRHSSVVPRLSRKKSWGSAKIARLDAEVRLAEQKQFKRTTQRRKLPVFSKLRYVLLCGEPVHAEKMLSQRLTRMSTTRGIRGAMSVHQRKKAKKNWSIVRKNSSFSEQNSIIESSANEDKDFDPHWWMIHPFSHFRRRWDLGVVIATAYVVLLAPFVIGFDVDASVGTNLFITDRFVDGIFFLDVFLNFLTGFVEQNRGGVVLDPKQVAVRYAKTWALLDLIASVPFDLVFPDDGEGYLQGGDRSYVPSDGTSDYSSVESSGYPPPPPPWSPSGSSPSDSVYRSAKVVRVIKLIRLLKLFRVLRVTRAIERLERGLSIRYGHWQIIKFIVVVLTLAHWQACGWFLVHAVQKSYGGDGGGDDGYNSEIEDSHVSATYTDQDGYPTTWVDVLAESQGTFPETLDDESRFAKYIACAYWATTTMTTIGYGDIVPVTAMERFLVIVAQLIGSCMFLYGLTQVTALVADTDSGDVEFAKVMDDANRYFERRSVPKGLREKVKEQLRHRRFFGASASVGGGGGFGPSDTNDHNHSYGQLYSDELFVSRLSTDVRREIRLWSLRDVLNRQPFFRDDDELFIKLTCDFLKRRFHGPNEKVITCGDMNCFEIFFLSRGDAEVRTSRGRFIKALELGKMFGEIGVVLGSNGVLGIEGSGMGIQSGSTVTGGSNTTASITRKQSGITRTADVLTVSFCETLVLSRDAFQAASDQSPATFASITRIARRKLSLVNKQRWRRAITAVLTVNHVLKNAGFLSLAEGEFTVGA